MSSSQIMIVVGVPAEDTYRVLDAISAAGGGVVGKLYTCAFMNDGIGRFKPNSAANPHLGKKGEINAVEETRIETFCDRNVAKEVIAAIRDAHPYEEPAIYLIPLLSEDDL